MPLASKLIENIVAISDFSRGKASEAFSKARFGEPVTVVRNNKPVAIITSVEEYSYLTELEEDYDLLCEALYRLGDDGSDPFQKLGELLDANNLTVQDLVS